MRSGPSSGVAVVLIASLGAGGCAEIRSEYVRPDGTPLQVYDNSVVRTGTQLVATGRSELRDTSGNLIATNTQYEHQNISWVERTWYPMQGNSRIDDESFFRIAGDSEAVSRYNAYHRSGRTRTVGGSILSGAGLGLLGTGIGLYVADLPKTDLDGYSGQTTILTTIGYATAVLGAAGIGLGIYLIINGRSRAKAKDVRLIDEPERLNAAARNYNATQLAAPPPVAPEQLPATAPPPPSIAPEPLSPPPQPAPVAQ